MNFGHFRILTVSEQLKTLDGSRTFASLAASLFAGRPLADYPTRFAILNRTKLRGRWRWMCTVAVRQLNYVFVATSHLVNAVDLSGLNAFTTFSRTRSVLGNVPSGHTRFIVTHSCYVVWPGRQITIRRLHFTIISSVYTLDYGVLST